MRKLRLALLAVFVVAGLLAQAKPTVASGFNAGYIIDDSIFTNAGDMSIGDVQNFLNNRNSVCLRNYTTPEPLGNNQYGGQVSAAHAIWKAGQLFGINPKVILVTLQKEQGLITRGDCPAWRYETALGYGCPDSAPCSTFGFSVQLYQGARHFRGFYDQAPGWYIPFTPGVRYIQYNPNPACGGSHVTIQNRATASLYSYTPYQPNASALAAGYGTGDSCGAYGNRNFWLYFSDWFGSPTGGGHSWSVVKLANDPRYFLQVGNTKRWIPTGEIYNSWGLQNYPVHDVSPSYFHSLPILPELGRVGHTSQYYYLMDGGKKHHIQASYLPLWGYHGYVSPPLTNLINSLPEAEPIGRFIKSTNAGDNGLWLMNGGIKQPVSAANSYHWGYVPTHNMTKLTPGYLSSLPTGPEAGTTVRFNNTNYIVDAGRLLRFANSFVEQDWQRSSFTSINGLAPSLMPSGVLQAFFQPLNAPEWYMAENGTKHYIPQGSLAEAWGGSSGNLTRVSPDLANSLTSSGNLTHIARDSSNGMVYVLDGQKHHIPNGTVLGAWLKSGQTAGDVPNYSPASFARLATGAQASPIVKPTNSPHVYSLSQGQRLYLPSGAVLNAWGSPRKYPVMAIAPSLTAQLPTGPSASGLVNNDSDEYLLDNGYLRSIPGDLQPAWGSSGSLELPATTLSLFDSASDVTSAKLTIGTNRYLMEAGHKLAANQWSDAYAITAGTSFSLPVDYLPGGGALSYLAQSTDSDPAVWLISGGQKYELPNFASSVSYGHISRGVALTKLSPATLDSFTTNPATPGLFIRTASSGAIKLLNFGSSLGFADGPTLTQFLGGSSPLVVSDSIFNSFILSGSVSRLIRDDAGKIYLVEGGSKRWITNGSAYEPYKHLPVTYLYGTTMALIPTGANIN